MLKQYYHDSNAEMQLCFAIYHKNPFFNPFTQADRAAQHFLSALDLESTKILLNEENFSSFMDVD